MSHGADPAELFDIEMDELATPDRFGRLQGTQFIQPQPTQNTADCGWRDAGLSGDLLARPALATQSFDLLDNRLQRRPAQPIWPG
jgi:hypothetical protein